MSGVTHNLFLRTIVIGAALRKGGQTHDHQQEYGYKLFQSRKDNLLTLISNGSLCSTIMDFSHLGMHCSSLVA
jgi:hypothetical protein